MKQAKHTPAPWTAEDIKSGKIYFVAGVAHRNEVKEKHTLSEDQRIAVYLQAIAQVQALTTH